MTKQSVAIPPIRSSKPAHCVSPRPHTDESLRRHHYGPLDQPATTWSLVKRGMPGGIGLLLLFVVATIALVAIGGFK